MKPDPPVRADGKCCVCGKSRQPERSRKYARLVAETDPFCSVECCNADEITKDTRHGSNVAHGTIKGYRVCACELCVAAKKGPAA